MYYLLSLNDLFHNLFRDFLVFLVMNGLYEGIYAVVFIFLKRRNYFTDFFLNKFALVKMADKE